MKYSELTAPDVYHDASLSNTPFLRILLIFLRKNHLKSQKVCPEKRQIKIDKKQKIGAFPFGNAPI